MIIGIDIGHNVSNDTGASSIRSEDICTSQVGHMVITELVKNDLNVICLTPGTASSEQDSLQQRVDKANINNVDMVISIHFNTCENHNGHGVEVFAMSRRGRAIADNILKEIVHLGFYNRGIKDGSHLMVVRETDAPAVLVECCFLDSHKDMQIFDSRYMASAIASGIIESI